MNTLQTTTKQGEEPEANGSVDRFIEQAIAAKAPVETMERLFALHKEVKAERAKEGFISALATFQSNCPIIEKTKKVLNKDGSVRYQFAPIDSIVKQIQKPLAQAELSYTWTVKNEPGLVTATCKVTHVLGHSEESSFQIPVDTEGFMTAPQKVASALTFAKRYSLCNALGISTGDEDTDATDVHKEKNAKSDKSKIIFLLKTLGHDTKDKDVIANTVEKLTTLGLVADNYGEIVSRLEILVKEKQEYESPDIR